MMNRYLHAVSPDPGAEVNRLLHPVSPDPGSEVDHLAAIGGPPRMVRSMQCWGLRKSTKMHWLAGPPRRGGSRQPGPQALENGPRVEGSPEGATHSRNCLGHVPEGGFR